MEGCEVRLVGAGRAGGRRDRASRRAELEGERQVYSRRRLADRLRKQGQWREVLHAGEKGVRPARGPARGKQAPRRPGSRRQSEVQRGRQSVLTDETAGARARLVEIGNQQRGGLEERV